MVVEIANGTDLTAQNLEGTPEIVGFQVVDNDWVWEGGILQTVKNIQVVAQNLATRLEMQIGEYFLDQSMGVPYKEIVLVKNPNLALIRSAFSDTILSTNGVTGIEVLTLVTNRETRELDMNAVVETPYGFIRFVGESEIDSEFGTGESWIPIWYQTINGPLNWFTP